MNQTVGPEDVRAAAAACREALSGVVDRDWSILAEGLEWSCRQTLEHIPSAQLFYASQLALQAKERLPRPSVAADQLNLFIDPLRCLITERLAQNGPVRFV